jgi:murein DD-endopeptidase MepM/ murein hydrolase activator NlpD
MRKLRAVVAVPAWLLCSCEQEKEAAPPPFDAAFVRLSAAEVATLPLAVSFQTPMGGEQGALAYNARPFRTARHLGDDLNGIGGWDSDLGDAVFGAGAGRVIYSGVPGPGWGNMIILAHRVPEPDAARGWRVYQTAYAHLETRLVREGEFVRRGVKIGTVGTADGRYLAHLHFEVRRSRSVYPGAGYADAPLDRVSPDAFVRAHPVAAGEASLTAP